MPEPVGDELSPLLSQVDLAWEARATGGSRRAVTRGRAVALDGVAAALAYGPTTSRSTTAVRRRGRRRRRAARMGRRRRDGDDADGDGGGDGGGGGGGGGEARAPGVNRQYDKASG